MGFTLNVYLNTNIITELEKEAGKDKLATAARKVLTDWYNKRVEKE